MGVVPPLESLLLLVAPSKSRASSAKNCTVQAFAVSGQFLDIKWICYAMQVTTTAAEISKGLFSMFILSWTPRFLFNLSILADRRRLALLDLVFLSESVFPKSLQHSRCIKKLWTKYENKIQVDLVGFNFLNGLIRKWSKSKQ